MDKMNNVGDGRVLEIGIDVEEIAKRKNRTGFR